ncbi:hypothetical protein [Vagococcus fluvialis]
MILKSILIVCCFITIWVFMFTRSFKGMVKRDNERHGEHKRKMERMQSEYEQKRKEFNEKWGK